MFNTQIINLRIIKFPFISDNLDIGILLYLLVVLEDFINYAVVLHHDDLVMIVSALFQD